MEPPRRRFFSSSGQYHPNTLTSAFPPTRPFLVTVAAPGLHQTANQGQSRPASIGLSRGSRLPAAVPSSVFFMKKTPCPWSFFFMKKTRAGGASSRSTQSGPNLPKRAHWPHWRGSGTERWAIGRSWPRGSRVWSIRGEEAVVTPDRRLTWGILLQPPVRGLQWRDLLDSRRKVKKEDPRGS